MAPSSISKVIRETTTSMTFLPLKEQALLAMSNAHGQLAFWNILDKPQEPIVTQPHWQAIREVRVHRQNPGSVFTAADDGTIRVTSLSAVHVRHIFRHPRNTSITSFDFFSPCVLIKGQNNGLATLLDCRSRSPSRVIFSCDSSESENADVKSISMQPLKTNVFAAACKTVVKLFDIRNPQDVLCELEHDRMLQWCGFSPCTGSRLLTYSMGDESRIYDTNETSLLKDEAMLPLNVIKHVNDTASLSFPFRPTWLPQREDCFLLGSVHSERQLELYNVKSGAKAASLQHELLGDMISQVAFHPTLNCLVGASPEGKAFAFVA